MHAPFEPDRRFLPNYEKEKWNAHKKKFASMIESMDKSLGDVMNTIDELGIADNTIVVFIASTKLPFSSKNSSPEMPARNELPNPKLLRRSIVK